MLGQAALRLASGGTAAVYPPGVNFLRVPVPYAARKGVSDPAAVAAGEIATDSTYGTAPTVMNDGVAAAPVMWANQHQTLRVWVRAPAITRLSEVRIAYGSPDAYPGAGVTLHAWLDAAWVAVAAVGYGGGGALLGTAVPPVWADLFRLTLTPGPSGWVGITEVEFIA